MTRTIAHGKTKKECQKEVMKKIKDGWEPITKIKEDDSYIGGRYICVMERPGIPVKSKFNGRVSHW